MKKSSHNMKKVPLLLQILGYDIVVLLNSVVSSLVSFSVAVVCIPAIPHFVFDTQSSGKRCSQQSKQEVIKTVFRPTYWPLTQLTSSLIW